MGFPVGYKEFFTPFPLTILFYTLNFLSTIQALLSTSLHRLRPQPPPYTPPPPLSAALMRQLLPLRLHEEEREIITCIVCLSLLYEGEKIRFLPNCKHVFHRSCLDRWIDLDHRTCPLCRTPFISDRMVLEFNQRFTAADTFDDRDDDQFMNIDGDDHSTIFSSF